jgi:glutathione synthase/RimK-type ligase-like ATP-grasp enzyme
MAWRVDLAASIGPRVAIEHRLLASRHRRSFTQRAARTNERIWRDAASTLGADVVARGDGILELRRGQTSTRVWQHITELDDPVSLRLALDRRLVHSLVAAAGAPVPEHATFHLSDVNRAASYIQDQGGLAVIKPASGTGGGEGITCSVAGRRDLIRAMLAAAPFDESVVVERQAKGDMYRLLFLDGELLAIVRRDPPSVVADGRANVAELIVAENRRRLAVGGDEALTLIRPDLDAVFTLRRAGMTPRSVPAAGRQVRVKTATSDNASRENVTVREPPAPSVVTDARAAVHAIGLRLAGVDIVTPDLGCDLRDVGGVIVEVNGTPAMRYHYVVADRDNADRIAVPILERLLSDPVDGARLRSKG